MKKKIFFFILGLLEFSQQDGIIHSRERSKDKKINKLTKFINDSF
jgi:hypothetical protein